MSYKDLFEMIEICCLNTCSRVRGVFCVHSLNCIYMHRLAMSMYAENACFM